MWIRVHSDFLALACTDLITQQLRPRGYYSYGSSMTVPNKARQAQGLLLQTLQLILLLQSYRAQWLTTPPHCQGGCYGLWSVLHIRPRQKKSALALPTLPAVLGSIFLEQEEPPRIISQQGMALDFSSQLCQQGMGQLDRKRLKFRVVPHLLLLLMLKSQSGFLEVVRGQTCLLHLSHSLQPARLYLALNCQSKVSRLEKVNSIALERNQFHLCSLAAGGGWLMTGPHWCLGYICTTGHVRFLK